MTRVVLVAWLVGAAACAHHETAGKPAPSETDETEDKAATAAPSVPASGAATGPTPTGPPTVAPAKPLVPVKIKIVVRSNPPKANVFWGKKKLGETPVIMERPRDSGPIDLVVRNDGYFPVHTRAYTFRNDALMVRMTKLEDRMTLFGAKHEAGESPDGGVAPGATTAPPTVPPPTVPPPTVPPPTVPGAPTAQ